MSRLYLEDEWKRTRPDLSVYLPESIEGGDATNEHFNVIQTPSGALLGFWTQATSENANPRPDSPRRLIRHDRCG